MSNLIKEAHLFLFLKRLIIANLTFSTCADCFVATLFANIFGILPAKSAFTVIYSFISNQKFT